MFSIIAPQNYSDNNYVNHIVARLQNAGQEFEVDTRYEHNMRMRLIAARENTILIIGALEITENLITVRNMRTNGVATIPLGDFFDNLTDYAQFA